MLLIYFLYLAFVVQKRLPALTKVSTLRWVYQHRVSTCALLCSVLPNAQILLNVWAWNCHSYLQWNIGIFLAIYSHMANIISFAGIDINSTAIYAIYMSFISSILGDWSLFSYAFSLFSAAPKRPLEEAQAEAVKKPRLVSLFSVPHGVFSFNCMFSLYCRMKNYSQKRWLWIHVA